MLVSWRGKKENPDRPERFGLFHPVVKKRHDRQSLTSLP
jgi:hypothetical protein